MNIGPVKLFPLLKPSVISRKPLLQGGRACFKRGVQHKKPQHESGTKGEHYNLIQRELIISWACGPRLEASSGHPQGRVAHSKSNPEQGACPKNLPNRFGC